MRAVLERDFLSEVSRPRAFLVRAALAALVAIFALGAFYVAHDVRRIPMDRLGAVVFQTGAIGLLAALALATPPLVVGSVLEERRAETLPLVLAAPGRPAGFAAAKLAARSGTLLVFAGAALPCMVIATLFGGVGAAHVVGLAALVLAVVLEMAGWSLWVSTVSRRPTTALVFAYLLPAIRWGVTLLVGAWLSPARRVFAPVRGPVASTIWSPPFLETTTPFGALATLLGLDPFELQRRARFFPAGGTGTPFLAEVPWLPALVVAVGVALLAVRFSGIALRTEAEPPRPSRTLRTARSRRLFRGCPGDGNPMVWKETRLLDAAGSRALYYRVLGLMMAAELGGMISLVAGHRPAIGFFAFHVALLSLIAVVNGAATIGNDRSRGSFDLLRASPLTAAEVLQGKAAGVLVGVGFLACVPACHLLLGLAVGVFSFRTVIAGFGMLVAIPLAWTAVGLSYGIHFPRPQAAVMRATLFLAAVSMGLPLVGSLLQALNLGANPGDIPLHAFVTDASPPLAVYDALRWVEESGGPHFPFRSVDAVHPARVGFLWFAGYAVFAALQPLVLPWLFRRRMQWERARG
jgi:ABC-type transport system involved in multi-copper enzyme maturation permease subunit